MKQSLLLIWLWCAPSFATSALQSYPTIDPACVENFKVAARVVLARASLNLAEKFPDPEGAEFDANEVTIRRSQLRGVDRYTEIMTYKGELVAQSEAARVRETLRFDIKVQPKYEKGGVYRFLFARALAENLGIRYVPARMPLKLSQNTKRFVDAAFGGDVAHLQREATDLGSKSSEEIWALRAKIVGAFEEMPAAQVRMKAGFDRVLKIVIDPHKAELGFIMERGHQLAGHGPIPVFVHESDEVNWALGSDGRVRPVSKEEAMSLGDYPEQEPDR